MRSVYKTLAGIFLFIGIIICFSNILMASPIIIGFTYMGNSSLFFPLFIILTVGVMGGFFTGLALMSGKQKDNIDEVDELDL